jgi:4-amino-4-deoxy-L-arabinose transferase-like glycosyltransferase
MEQSVKTRIWIIALNLFLLFVLVYALTSSDVTVYDTDASHARYEVTKSIVERFDLSIPKGLGVTGPDGRDYSWFGLGSSALAVPLYSIGAHVGTPEYAVSLMNQLMGAATAVLVFLFSLSLGYSFRTSILVSLFYGFATFAWPLTKQPFDHTVETFFVLLSIFLTYLYTAHNKTPYLLFSSFSFGCAFLTRLTSLLVLPSLLILVIIAFSQHFGFKAASRQIIRAAALFALVLLPFFCLNCWYNYYRFGSIFETGYSLIAAKTGLNFFSGTPLLTGLSGLFMSPGKGFFYYSPVAILSLFSFRSFMKKHCALSWAFLLIIASYFLFLSKNIYWHGDWAWGPRYLLVITPLFVIPIGAILDSEIWRSNRLRRMAISFVLTVGITIQLIAISVDFQKYFYHLAYEDKVRFNVALGSGVQTITEPPIEIYFNWRYSPIIMQVDFIYEIAKNIHNYSYTEPPENAPIYDKIKTVPLYNLYDFWWLYTYFIEKSSSGFMVALILLLIAVYTAIKLRNITPAYEDG